MDVTVLWRLTSNSFVVEDDLGILRDEEEAETEYHHIALTGLEHTIYPRLAYMCVCALHTCLVSSELCSCRRSVCVSGL